MIAENSQGKFFSVLSVLLMFLLVFAWWTCSDRELLRQEGLYATCAQEYHFGMKTFAHGVVQQEVMPLYPAVVALLVRTGVPMEQALRLISVVMLAAWALLAGVAVAMRRDFRAGVVTVCCCVGSIFAMGKGVDGAPVTMSAFFLLAAQLVFFHYGSRLANWNKAWLAASVLWLMAFLSGGPIVLLYSVVPLFFLRRPLSVGSKFNAPGFFIGAALLVVVCAVWALGSGFTLNSEFILVSDFTTWDYLKQLISFPAVFVIRLLPWSFLCWLPLCAALNHLDPTPVFSKYLRTLFFSTFALFWLLPDRPASELFLIVGPLAIMTGLNYELGIRRYWKWFRQSFCFGELFLFLLAGAMAVLIFFPAEWLDMLPFIHAKWWRFRELEAYAPVTFGAVGGVTVLGVIFHIRRRKAPIWFMILMVTFGLAIFYNALLLPNFSTEKRWRSLGADIAAAIQDHREVQALYKLDIDGMYCGLFYSGVPVKKIRTLDELSPDQTVYLISSQFPRHFGWRWTPLLPPDYKFEDKSLFMWRGIPVPPEERDETGAL